jgi:hypothetical protein|tara:strand:- start:12447 stop:13061 length:615 start_codon:yes stop_codon:yes gene_type:complete
MTKCVNIDSESKISDLIYIFDDLLDEDKCDQMIQWYRDNPDLHKQLVGNAGYEHQLDLESLRGHEATMSSDNPLSDVLTEVCLKAYQKISENGCTTPQSDIFINGHAVRKYEKDEGVFETHVDQYAGSTVVRLFGIIVYHNDVEEGGETIFPTLGVGVKPKKGRVLIFPCNWMFPHKGCIPTSGPKYCSAMFISFVPEGTPRPS